MAQLAHTAILDSAPCSIFSSNICLKYRNYTDRRIANPCALKDMSSMTAANCCFCGMRCSSSCTQCPLFFNSNISPFQLTESLPQPDSLSEEKYMCRAVLTSPSDSSSFSDSSSTGVKANSATMAK
jgi:hypothetical protein